MVSLQRLARDLKGNVLVLFTRVEGQGLPLHDLTKANTKRPVHLIYGDVSVDVREEVRSVCETSNDNIIFG